MSILRRMRASLGVLLAAAWACGSPRPVSAPPAAVPHIIVGADVVRVDGAPVARLEDGVFPASERTRRFEIRRVVEALRAPCAATGKNAVLDVDGTLPYETLFGLTFSMARAGCRGVDLRLASQAGTVEHRFPRSTNGEAPSDGPPMGGELGLTMTISAVSVTLWSRDGKLGSEGSPMVLDEPSTPARAQRLTATLRHIVDARWPGASAERRSQSDRQIEVRADATLRAADLLPLLRATVHDADGRVLFPEHVLRAPPPARSPEPEAPTRTLQPGMVVIGSEPSGAEVFVDGRAVGSTPLAFTVASRSAPLTVRLERAGYEPCVLEVDTTKGAQATCRLRPRAP